MDDSNNNARGREFSTSGDGGGRGGTGRGTAGREVIDPVTHLPITTHDITDDELERVAPRHPPPASESPPAPQDPQPQPQTQNGSLKEKAKDGSPETRWVVDDEAGGRRARILAAAVAGVATACGTLAATLLICVGAFIGTAGAGTSAGISFPRLGAVVVACVAFGTGIAIAVWKCTGDDGHEDNDLMEPEEYAAHKPPESTAWLNSLLSSLWPIVNPALFMSLADMLEDVMQASLPTFVKGVRVADLGQGNESLRILGIRGLEAADSTAASSAAQGGEGGGYGTGSNEHDGDFANFEIALAYKAHPTSAKNTPAAGTKGRHGGGLKKRVRNAHLLIEFRTVGGIDLPVWVELTGFLATARVRVRLTPNPPFLSRATLTLLGQPKVSISCVPLAKNFLNVMDLPVVNRYLQSCIDEAVGMYVAPRSLTLDLKTLLTGREKMDTDTVGVIVVRVVSAVGFKDGDACKKWPTMDDNKKRGDPYVTVGWGKYGKGIWSTRVIENEREPVWDETNAVLVGPPEINAEEDLRLQLWDSDRGTADDLLGVVEVPLHSIMSSQSATRNCMAAREDPLCDYEGKSCPGTLRWEVGYFAKSGLEGCLSENQSRMDIQKTKRKIESDAEAKLAEAKGIDESSGEQHKSEDLKERTDEIIAGSPPSAEWPSGILYIRIEQITGLEVEHTKESGVREGGDECSDDLPSAYCSIILNHQKVYKTRTKLKDNKPFFDAGTEKFIRDFRTTSAIISVRDHRSHEADPLLGVVVVPLHKIFSTRSQLTASYPLTGGIGFGRLRLSLAFRSVQLRLPRQLLGWSYGTLEISPPAVASDDLSADLRANRLVFRTLYGKRKLFPESPSTSSTTWTRGRRERPLRLAVCGRYASCLLVQFRKYSIGPDTTSAFGVLWFKDLCDDDEVEVHLPVRRKSGGNMHRAVRNAVGDGAEGGIAGTVKLKLRFHPGLSGYHQPLAGGASDHNMTEVMEILDAAEDAKEIEVFPLSTAAASSSSDDSSSDGERLGETKDNDGGGGFKDELKEYKRDRKDLHRRHRGLMQWQAARKLAWVGREMKERGHELSADVKGKLKHRPGGEDKVETEV